jgi:sigma-B regulation protein RsbU (phosphoserine phosphatase)
VPGGKQPPSSRPRPVVSYRASLILSLSLLVLATGLVISLIAFRGGRAGTTELAHSMFHEVSDHAVTRTRAFLLRAVPLAQAIGGLADLGLATDDRDLLGRQLTVFLRANPGVSWVSYSDERGAFVGAYRTAAGELRVNQSHIDAQGRTPVVEYDVLPDGSWRPFRSEGDSGFDPRRRPFYVRAREAGRVVWTPPYIFYDQGVSGITCANPLYDARGQLRGVVTVDFDLDTLSQFAGQWSLSPNAQLFIMAADGTLLAHPAHQAAATSRPGPGARGRGELLKVGEGGDALAAAFDAQLRPDDRTPGPGGADRARQFEFTHDGTDYFARATAFTVDGDLAWVVGVMAPQADFLAGARRTSALSALASLGAMLLAVVVAMALARRVSGPIVALATFMEGVGKGDLSARARLGGAREFRQLSDALDQMLHQLRDRTRLRSDLAVAMEVQQGLLPASPPQLAGLDVYGFSQYCDETGGDYFDYLVVDRHGALPPGDDGLRHDDRGGLLVAIGDVVGHGIGASILMAGARGVLHSRASTCGHLGELMTHLNHQLVRDTGGRRFVTMMLWYVDRHRATACWANAGHDPVLIYDAATDAFTEGCRAGDIPLGIDAAVVYEEQSFGPVRPGQVVVLGTDGIWEALDDGGRYYGRERLMAAVRAAATGTAQEIATAVRRDLDAFRRGQSPRDDVTLVIIKVLPLAVDAAVGASP